MVVLRVRMPLKEGNVRLAIVLTKELDSWTLAEAKRKGLNRSSYIRFVLASMRERQLEKEATA